MGGVSKEDLTKVLVGSLDQSNNYSLIDNGHA